ncbi:DUF2625 family protein [Nocardia sp. NPDC005978]|uniref:DUF2625 family protein n=1 Tax=unclassified Nocardia TaxID=2637762 RepID=UPI00339F2376
MSSIRAIQELADVKDPAWPELRELVRWATVPVTVLPPDPERARDTLIRLQVTARSTLGALALNTGGILVDYGWLRILGGGSAELPDLATSNGVRRPGELPTDALIVAVDVLGGRFAVNGGELPGEPGEVCYFGPDTLAWNPIGFGHSAFVHWALGGGTAEFYEDLRWPDWHYEIRTLTLGQGISVYPPLWTVEGRTDIGAASRCAAPMSEVIALLVATAKTLH